MLSPWMLSSSRETHLGFSTIFCVGMGRLLTRFGVAQLFPEFTVPICNIGNPSDGPSVTEVVTLHALCVTFMSYQWD